MKCGFLLGPPVLFRSADDAAAAAPIFFGGGADDRRRRFRDPKKNYAPSVFAGLLRGRTTRKTRESVQNDSPIRHRRDRFEAIRDAAQA